MTAMHFKQVRRFILAKKYFGIRGTLIIKAEAIISALGRLYYWILKQYIMTMLHVKMIYSTFVITKLQ